MTAYEHGFLSACRRNGVPDNIAGMMLEKKSQFIDSLADKVNFLANVKVLSDASNETILSTIDGGRTSNPVNSSPPERKAKISVLFSGDTLGILTPEQREAIIATAKKISEKRKKK